MSLLIRDQSNVKSKISSKCITDLLKSANKFWLWNNVNNILYLIDILMYGSDSRLGRHYLEATEVWFYRTILRTPWKDAGWCLGVLVEIRALFSCIKNRQSTFIIRMCYSLGHTKNIFTNGKIEGTSGWGRLREKVLDRLTSCKNLFWKCWTLP